MTTNSFTARDIKRSNTCGLNRCQIGKMYETPIFHPEVNKLQERVEQSKCVNEIRSEILSKEGEAL